MKLITESSYDVELFEDNQKQLKIVGIFSSAEVLNANGRKYKRETLEREVGKLSESIKNRCLWGELSHPSVPEVNPERISHLIESLEWKGNDLYGRAKVLDTPMGNIAKTLIKEGKVGISSRGLGTVSEDGYVNENYNMITYDIVLQASNEASRFVNGIYEGQEFYLPSNEPKITLEQAQKEYKRHIWQVLEKIGKEL